MVKATVLVMTYNHAAFVGQALDSVLEQQVDFPFEIVISEDRSTDDTRAIVIDYQERYPQLIRLLLSERNIRSNAVVRRGIEAARGEYIALLDGDDYWISPHKLQKQIDFLDRHPECAMCFHNAVSVDQSGALLPGRPTWTPQDHPRFSTLEDIWMGNFIATCTTMFRRQTLREIPAWYDGMFPITDWPLHILSAEHGMIGYIEDTMGAYRQHAGGFYTPLSEAQKLASTLAFYHRMNANLNYRHNTLVKIAISKYFFEWADEYLRRGDVARARRCFITCLTGRPINRFIRPKQLLRMGARLTLARSSTAGPPVLP